jgi:hypothetical protein
VPPGHPAHGKFPREDVGAFLCDAFRCLPELADPADIAAALARTRTGLA